jgi:hypothetical protein
MKLSVNNNIHFVTSKEQLEDIFRQYEPVAYKEFSIGNGKTSLLAVMNSRHTLCIYFRDMDGGESMHSFNPEGDKDKYDEFIISNGQRDEYSEDMLIDNRTAYEAIACYLESGKACDKIIWEDD